MSYSNSNKSVSTYSLLLLVSLLIPSSLTFAANGNTNSNTGNLLIAPSSSTPAPASSPTSTPTTTAPSTQNQAPSTSNSTPSGSTVDGSTSTTTSPSQVIPPQAPIIVPAQPPTTPPGSDTSKPVPPPTSTPAPSTIVPPQPGVQLGQYEKQKAIQDFVHQAADYIIANGKVAALREFSRDDGVFTKGTLYIFAIDYKGNLLAAPRMEDSRRIAGDNQMDYKDPDGTPVTQLLIQKAKSGGGWTKYKWQNPVTKQMECKNAYSMPGDGDFLIASGYYFQPLPNGKCE